MKKLALDMENNKKTACESLSAFGLLVPYIYPYRLRLAAASGALLTISIGMLSLARGLAFIVDEGLSGDIPVF